MIFGEGPIVKNIARDLNKLFLQGTRAGQPINNVEGDAAADQGTTALMADRDPVIRDISTGLGWAGREVTVSGTGALQLVNSLGRPLKSWSVELAPYQEGSGDPSPENVRPIHGTHKLTLWTSGKNLLGINEAYGESSTITITDGVAIGTNLAFNNSRIYIPSQLVGKRLTWSVKVTVPATLTRVYTRANINGSGINGSDVLSGTTGVSNVSFTPTSTSDYINITYGSGNGTLTVSDFQVEFGSTATDYVLYAAPSQTVIDVPALGKNVLNIEAGTHNAWSFVNIPNNLRPNTQYTLSLNGGTTYYYRLYLGNSQQSTRALTQAITGGESTTFTTPSDMSTEPLLALAGSVSGAGNESLSNILPQVELGHNKTLYEPYTNSVYYGTVGNNGGVSRSYYIKPQSMDELLLVSDDGTHLLYRYKNTIPLAASITGGSGAMCNFTNNFGNAPTHGTTPIVQFPYSTTNSSLFFRIPSTINPLDCEFCYTVLNESEFAIDTPAIPTTEGDGTIWVTAEDGIISNFSATYLQSE